MPLPNTIRITQSQAIPIPLLSRVASLAPLPSGGAVLAGSMPFLMQRQLQANWCWAAVAASTSRYYLPATTWSQCRVACTELGNENCCDDPTPLQCNVDWYLDRGLTTTGNLQTWAAGQLAFSSVKAEVNAKRATGFRIGWTDGGGHFVVISGYSDNGILQTVDVKDPWFGDSVIPFDVFLSSYQSNGSCTHYYFTRA
jgi:hypothetical protein